MSTLRRITEARAGIRRITEAIRQSLASPDISDKIEPTDERIKSDPNHVGHCTRHGAVSHINWRCPLCRGEVSA